VCVARMLRDLEPSYTSEWISGLTKFGISSGLWDVWVHCFSKTNSIGIRNFSKTNHILSNFFFLICLGKSNHPNIFFNFILPRNSRSKL
jgi:hypothetical protein